MYVTPEHGDVKYTYDDSAEYEANERPRVAG
jgi:hypothetical protein